jgi:hypothetical protein
MHNKVRKTYEVQKNKKFFIIKSKKISCIETRGVSLSISAIKTPISAIRTVKSRARNGSPAQFGANILRNGITSSLAIACSKRGAP